MVDRATVSASTAASTAPAAPRQCPIIDLIEVTGTDRTRSPNKRCSARDSAASFCDVAVPWAGYVLPAVFHGLIYTTIALVFGLILFEDRDLA